MPERWIATTAIAGIFSSILAVWARVWFVRRSEVFDKGRSHFQYAADCAVWQNKCADRTCAKINELKTGQIQVWEELRSMNDKVHETTMAVTRIEQWIKDSKNGNAR